MPHPMLKRELCGADALATIQRDEFGMPAGKDYGFSMEVTLRIQVDAIAQEAAAAAQSPIRSPSPACRRGAGVEQSGDGPRLHQHQLALARASGLSRGPS